MGLRRVSAGAWSSPALLHALSTDAVVARADVGVLELLGPGAVPAFQGLFTNDIEQPGDGALVYGALLTPKGMIVVDGWAARLGAVVRFTVAAEGRDPALAMFQKWVPPRLARHHDRTPETTVLRIVGPRALALAEAAHLPLPAAPDRVVRGAAGGATVEVGRPADAAPFSLQASLEPDDAAGLLARLGDAGVREAPGAALEVARVVAGWPALGAEMDERTLPQEVRFDEIGGVSYTKGCYIGQETVSRLHFRGHANRQLRGLALDDDPGALDPLPLFRDEREVGRVTSLLGLAEGWLGLGIVRREVAPGDEVRAGGARARIVALPFPFPWPGPA